MDIQIGANGFELRDNLEEYAMEKIGHLQKYQPGIKTARVELANEKTKSLADQNVVQVTLSLNGATIRTQERASTFQAAVDAATLSLRKQLERFKGRVYRVEQRGWRQMKETGIAPAPPRALRITRRKNFAMKAVAPEEAIEELEALGHDFYFFLNAETNAHNVLYRRRAGGYGLIEPANQ